jgi:hypothetical protein
VNPRIPLTTADLERATRFFEEMKKIKPNVRRTDLSDQDRRAFEIAGKLGEVAIGRFLGLAVNWDVHIGSDGRFDFALEDGRTLDVKAVAVHTRLDYDFKVLFGQKERIADLVALVLIPPTLSFGELVGYITRERFVSSASIERGWRHRGVEEPLVLTRKMLVDIRELRAA